MIANNAFWKHEVVMNIFFLKNKSSCVFSRSTSHQQHLFLFFGFSPSSSCSSLFHDTEKFFLDVALFLHFLLILQVSAWWKLHFFHSQHLLSYQLQPCRKIQSLISHSSLVLYDKGWAKQRHAYCILPTFFFSVCIFSLFFSLGTDTELLPWFFSA